MMNKAAVTQRYVIGGDFELRALSLGPGRGLAELTHGLAGTWTASGRAALWLILSRLEGYGVRHIHLPSYLCKSILLPIHALGWDYSFYPVDPDLTARPDPPPGSAVLLIHYFGWLNPATSALRAEAGRAFHLIEDASQALLTDWSAPPGIERLVFLSPRKFGPTLMGGWCNLTADIPQEPSGELEALAWRSLAARLARGIYLSHSSGIIDPVMEEFYLTAFHAVESYLDAHSSEISVPSIVQQIMAGLDWQQAMVQRRTNWQQLREQLGHDVESFTPTLPEGAVPLGYAARLRERDRVRARLAEQRIFCPVHWPLPAEVDSKRFPEAARVSKSCLTLPVDQRYGEAGMARLAEAIRLAL